MLNVLRFTFLVVELFPRHGFPELFHGHALASSPELLARKTRLECLAVKNEHREVAVISAIRIRRSNDHHFLHIRPIEHSRTRTIRLSERVFYHDVTRVQSLLKRRDARCRHNIYYRSIAASSSELFDVGFAKCRTLINNRDHGVILRIDPPAFSTIPGIADVVLKQIPERLAVELAYCIERGIAGAVNAFGRYRGIT